MSAGHEIRLDWSELTLCGAHAGDQGMCYVVFCKVYQWKEGRWKALLMDKGYSEIHTHPIIPTLNLINNLKV